MSDQIDSYLETLVGEGRKYATPEELAKAYVHADLFIGTLKNEKSVVDKEVEELRARMDQTKSLADLLNLANQSNIPTQGNQGDPAAAPKQEGSSEAPNKDSSLDVGKVVESYMLQREQENNQKIVAAAVSNKFNGDSNEINNFLKAKAQELNVPIKWLDETAGVSPNLVINLLGLNDTKEKQEQPKTPGISGAVNTQNPVLTQGGQTQGVRGASFYNELRRQDPHKFQSVAVQKQREADILALGKTKFFES